MSEPYKDLNHKYYHQYYQFQGRSKWMEKIWKEAFGEEYPEGLAHYGYLTRHDLAEISSRLGLSPGDSLLDIGCGTGGPGLYLAEEFQLKLTGVDLIAEAVAQANAFQTSFELAHPAQFEEGDFYSLPVADGSMDAVICIDSLWAAPNKITALAEVKRVLKPGGKFIFTHWDLLAVEPVPLLEQSGLTFVERIETPDWKSYQRKVYDGIEVYQEELVAEMGTASHMLFYEAQSSPPYLDLSVRRIYHWELR